jgi:uncharacterized protein (DUF305 family)
MRASSGRGGVIRSPTTPRGIFTEPSCPPHDPGRWAGQGGVDDHPNIEEKHAQATGRGHRRDHRPRRPGGLRHDDEKSGSASSSEQSSVAFNKADVTFATSMVPHHQQALEMVDLMNGRQLDPAVRELAGQIEKAQSPEIDTMSGWLRDWGKPVPAATGNSDSHDMGGMDMGSQDMPGMMSADEMTGLGQASGAEFQKMWLQLMIRHHQGAVTMAQAELSDGKNPDARKLARSIIDGQQAEIDQMNQLLRS